MQTDVSHGLGEYAGKDGSQRLKLKARVSCLLRAESGSTFISRNAGCTVRGLHLCNEERGRGYKEKRRGAANHGD